MKITRLNQKARTVAKELEKQEKRPYRKIKRQIKESEIGRITDTTNPLNVPGIFTYNDVNRNLGAINMIQHQVNQAISNFGNDLVYFRKYNTFFKEGEENTANLIYGEDTVAQFYASGSIRAYVSIDNMSWNFNQIGFESVEQITLYLSIEQFRQVFVDRVGKVETKHVEVPVSGNLVNNEVTGMIREPEFQAFVYAQVDDNLNVKNSEIKMVPKEVASGFYLQQHYNTSLYPISGNLHGRLRRFTDKPFDIYGLLEGNLSFHGYKNIEDSETWDIAPQVGDYFSFKTSTGLSEEWEINQIYDRNLTKSGINPLLGKYVYQISATRRIASHEQNTTELDLREPGDDIEEILGNIAKPKVKPEYSDAYIDKKGQNVQNKRTNKLAKNVYDYVDKSDHVYGGVQTTPKAK